MLIIEENKEFMEFKKFMALPCLHITNVSFIKEPNFWFFEYFFEGLFLKMLYEDVGDYRRNRRAHCYS